MHARNITVHEETQFPHAADQSETVSMRAPPPSAPQTALEWIEEGTGLRVEEDKKRRKKNGIEKKKKR